eukprot:393888-Alexandrium_andersonii.AAC.1
MCLGLPGFAFEGNECTHGWGCTGSTANTLSEERNCTQSGMRAHTSTHGMRANTGVQWPNAQTMIC